MTTKDLAIELGCGPHAVLRAAKRAGVTPTLVGPIPTWTKAQAKLITEWKRTHRPGRPRKVKT